MGRCCTMIFMTDQRFSVTSATGEPLTVRFRVNDRAKRLILRLDPKSGEAVVTAPRENDFPAAKRFASSRVSWIEAQSARMPRGTELIAGNTIPFRGEPHLLENPQTRGRTQAVSGTPNIIRSPGAEVTFSDRIVRFLRLEAKADICEAVDKHAARLGAQPGKITIRDTRSRWGSCSSKGHLNFSWRLILAPPEILDYVAAHEVAHLIEMNHSRAFWKLVETSYGPHEKARNWLKRHGGRLHAVGSSGSAGG